MTLGSLVSTFIATILIIIVLIVFAVYSGIVKATGSVSSGVKVAKEDVNGIGNIDSYFNNFNNLVKARFLIFVQGEKINQALQEAGYEK